MRARTDTDDPAFSDLLRACETARHDPDLKPAGALALTQSLDEYAASLNLFGPTKKERA